MSFLAAADNESDENRLAAALASSLDFAGCGIARDLFSDMMEAEESRAEIEWRRGAIDRVEAAIDRGRRLSPGDAAWLRGILRHCAARKGAVADPRAEWLRRFLEFLHVDLRMVTVWAPPREKSVTLLPGWTWEQRTGAGVICDGHAHLTYARGCVLVRDGRGDVVRIEPNARARRLRRVRGRKHPELCLTVYQSRERIDLELLGRRVVTVAARVAEIFGRGEYHQARLSRELGETRANGSHREKKLAQEIKARCNGKTMIRGLKAEPSPLKGRRRAS